MESSTGKGQRERDKTDRVNSMSSSNKQAMNERKKVLFDQSLFFCFQQGYYTASPKTKTAYDEDLYPHLSLKTKKKKKEQKKE